MHTEHGKSKKPIHFQGQNVKVKVTVGLCRISAHGSLWAGYRLNTWPQMSQTGYVNCPFKEEEAYPFSRSLVKGQGHNWSLQNVGTWIFVGSIQA